MEARPVAKTRKEQEETTLDAINAEWCRRDFKEFVRAFWPSICNDPLIWNWHMDILCDECQEVMERVFARLPKLYDLVINVPPGSSKSSICSQMLVAWSWARDPALRFLTGSYAQDLSYEQAQYTRDIVNSDLWNRLYPETGLLAGRDAKSNYRTTAMGQRVSCSVGGAATGFHAHCIIIDDPLNPKQAASETELKNANEWMDKTLTTRKVSKELTPLILIMQRLAEDDCSGHILDKEGKEVRNICIPAEDGDNVSPTWLRKYYRDGLMDPVRISRAVCTEARIDLGSYGYAGQFLQRPAPEEGGLIKVGWFQRVDWHEFHRIAGNAPPVWDFVSDGAYTANEANDPCGIMAYTEYNNSLFIRYSGVRHLEQPEYEAWIFEVFGREQGNNLRSRVFIEPKANGISTAQNMKRRSKLNVILDTPPTRDKVSRVKDIQPFLEAGRVFLIARGGEEWVDRFLGNIKVFPNGKHDEDVDMLCMAVNKVQQERVSRPGRSAPAVKAVQWQY